MPNAEELMAQLKAMYVEARFDGSEPAAVLHIVERWIKADYAELGLKELGDRVDALRSHINARRDK
jgi:hypothetical protein